MPPEDISDILLHAVPNSWARQAYRQGWDLEMKIYKATCELFEIMEVAKIIYKDVNTSKTPIRAEANRAIHIRKRNVGEAASPTNPETGRAGKRRTRNAYHPRDWATRGKTWLLHGPGNSTEYCKVMKD